MTMPRVEVSVEDNNEVLDYIKESIRFALGGPIVDVELSDKVLESLIKRTLTVMAQYTLMTVWETVPIVRTDIPDGTVAYYKEIDTSTFPLPIAYILDVLKSRGGNDVLTNTSDISGIPLGWAIRSGRSSMNNYTDTISNISTMYNERALVARLAGAFKDQCTFDYDKARKLLRIDVGYPASSNVTIEYVPILDLEHVGLVKNVPQALDFLTQYAIALSMVSLGRARGKYTISNYDWSVSSSELITTGEAKMKELINMVNTSYSRIMTD